HGAAVSGGHHPCRRRHAAALGQTRREPTHHDRGGLKMRRPPLPEMSPWKRQPLTIPPDSLRAWVTLAAWEFWMGALVSVALLFGEQLVANAASNVVTVYDFTKCYAAAAVVPCERVAYRTGQMTVVLNLVCGVLLLAIAAWWLWELWNAVAPPPVTD